MTTLQPTLCLVLLGLMTGCQKLPIVAASVPALPTQAASAQAKAGFPMSDLLSAEIAQVKAAIAKAYPQATIQLVEGLHTRYGFDFSASGTVAGSPVTISGSYFSIDPKGFTKLQLKPATNQQAATASSADKQALLGALQAQHRGTLSVVSLLPGAGPDQLGFVVHETTQRNTRVGLETWTWELTGTFDKVAGTATVTGSKLFKREID